MKKIVKVIGNAVVTCIFLIGGIIFIAVISWQNRGRQKQGDMFLSEEDNIKKKIWQN